MARKKFPCGHQDSFETRAFVLTLIQTLWGLPTQPEHAVPELVQAFEICPPLHLPVTEPEFPLPAAEHQALYFKEPQMTIRSHITATYSLLLG